MGRRAVGVVVAAGALVAAVVLVRPGTEAPPEDLARPTPSAAPSPDASVDVPGVPDVETLRRTRLADLRVDGGGIGPFRLGSPVDELVDAGWQRSDQPDGCARLRGASVEGADLRGWALDGTVESLQVRVHAEAPEPPATDGFPVGLPADETVEAVGTEDGLTDTSLPVGQRTVRLLEWGRGGTEVVASDLGGDVVRHIEVATPEGRRCTPTEETLQAEFPPDTLPASREALADPTAYADLLPRADVVGLSSGDAAAAGVAVPDGGSDERCRSTTEVDADGRRVSTVVQDGRVVGQRVSRPGPDLSSLDLAFRTVDGVTQREIPGSSGAADESGRTVTLDLLYREQLVPAVDGGVLVGPPVVVSRLVGDECPL